MNMSGVGGVWPAAVTPFGPDRSVDRDALSIHVAELAGTRGVRAVVVNGHAAEATSLSREERRATLAAARAACPSDIGLVAGIVADSCAGAIALARDAESAGADAVLLFPPSLFGIGVQSDPAIALNFLDGFCAGTELPVCLFQFALSSGYGYPTPALLDLCSRPQVFAVKEGSDDPIAYEANLRAIKASHPSISVLTTNNGWLLGSLAIGGDGIISGMGSVASDLLAELLEAVQCNDLGRARLANDRIHMLTQVFYRPPAFDMHNRMKVALEHLGRIPSNAVREPLMALSEAEIRQICATVDLVGLASSR